MNRIATGIGVAVVTLGALVAPRAIANLGSVSTSVADTTALSRAIDFFEDRLQADPGNPVVASRLADRYMLRFQRAALLDDLRRAEELVVEALPLTPNVAGAHVRLSSIRLARHDFAGAHEAALTALAIDSLDHDALGARFDAALALGRYQEAEASLRRLDGDRPASAVRKAIWQSAQGNDTAAFDRFDRVCRELVRTGRSDQLAAWCWTELAGIELSRSGRRAAERLLRRALAALPGYRGAIEALANLSHADGDWRRALRLYESIATDAHPDLYLRLAEVHAALGDHDAAERRTLEFVRIARAPDAEPLFAPELALFYARHPATRDTALAIALREVERRPTVESWDVLASVHLLRDEPQRALEASDRARSWGAPSPSIDANRGRILVALGRQAEGVMLLESAYAEPALLAPHLRVRTPSRPESVALGNRDGRSRHRVAIRPDRP